MTDSCIPSHRALWQSAGTLEDLGELTAQWLEGRITYLPGYLAPAPDEETAPLAAYLADANRGGYVTDFSQPGMTYADGDGQRAAVTGFCTEELADRLADAVLGTDLVVISLPPGLDYPAQIPVTIDGGAPFTWVGGAPPADAIDHTYGDDCPGAVAALRTAWYVTAFDPVWGREALLWERLSAVWTR